MRTATLLHAFALFAFALFTTVVAVPNDAGAVAARNASPVSARAPRPSPEARHEARAPKPSNAKRSLTKRKQRVLSDEEVMSQYLCPQPLRVCPIDSGSRPTTVLEWIHDGFECVDDHEDLTSCGGCGIVDDKYDCTKIQGSLGVACIMGGCRVDSCHQGYALSLDRKSCFKV